MLLDPDRSPEDWHTYLSDQAERAWGLKRWAAIDGALTRMAGAIARVAARTPRPDTPLGQTPEVAGRRRVGGRA